MMGKPTSPCGSHLDDCHLARSLKLDAPRRGRMFDRLGRWLAAVACAGMVLAGCSGPRMPLNPPRLVTPDDTDMSIQLFMQATLLLAHFYHFQTIQYSAVRARAARTGLSTLPFMPPETVRATPELVGLVNDVETTPQSLDALSQYVVSTYGYKPLVKYYIRTGLRASQLICRNYLLRLEENNRYLEFLRREFGVAYGLANGILLAADANGTLVNAFAISRSFFDGAVTTYEEYRFLDVDREAARVLVETAQNKLAEFYLQQVDAADKDSTDAKGGYTFSDAVNAVSVIEYQCTREGIHALLTNSVNNTPTNLMVDAVTGTINFKSAKIAVDAAANPPQPKDRNATPIVVPPQTNAGQSGGGTNHHVSNGGGGQQKNPDQKTPVTTSSTTQILAKKTDDDIKSLLNDVVSHSPQSVVDRFQRLLEGVLDKDPSTAVALGDMPLMRVKMRAVVDNTSSAGTTARRALFAAALDAHLLQHP